MTTTDEATNIGGNGIFQVFDGSTVIIDTEVIEERIISELIISEDYNVRFDFNELGILVRKYQHIAIVDTHNFNILDFERIFKCLKDNIGPIEEEMFAVIYIKGACDNKIILNHLIHQSSRMLVSIAKPKYIISNNLTEDAYATMFFFKKQDKPDIQWQNKVDKVIEEKHKNNNVFQTFLITGEALINAKESK